MKLAFGLFEFFYFGGLQGDFLRIAEACYRRGHEIHVYTSAWEGKQIEHFHLHLLPSVGLQNHTRNQIFATKFQQAVKENNYDLVVGFNKMPGLDVYFAADVCALARIKKKHFLLATLLPRYHHQATFEKAVFARGQQTEVMYLSHKQKEEFTKYYQTEAARLHFLPPGISRDFLTDQTSSNTRKRMRAEFALKDDDYLLLMVASAFKTKGVDRSLLALASLSKASNTYLYIVGDGNAKSYLRLAHKLKVADRIKFLGGREDVKNFMLAADLFIHPALLENTGMVLLEAIVSGLPVLTIDVCGYASYVKEANAGVVLTSPFEQRRFNIELKNMLDPRKLAVWHENGIHFSRGNDLFSLPEKAADLIDFTGSKRAALSQSSIKTNF